MIFDWVDLERKGRLSLEEFSSGLSMSAPVGGAWGWPRAGVLAVSPARGQAGLTERPR